MTDIDLKALQNLVQSGYHELKIDPYATWDKYGMVKATYQDGLVLFNYTAECNAKPPEAWNTFEKLSRGLILNSRTGDIVARPFEKFWNWREDQIASNAPVVEVTEKLDGSLGIIYFWKDDWYVATRGSFSSEQAIWATEFLHKNYDIRKLEPSYTYLVEIIYPENRIVVNYGPKEDLILIGIKTLDGIDPFYSNWVQIADYVNFNVPRTIVVNNIGDIVERLYELGDNEEGYVARLSDGTRLKFKSEEYLRLHQFVSHFSFKHVAEVMMNGALAELEALCPSNYRDLFNKYCQIIEDDVANVTYRVENAYLECREYALHYDLSEIPLDERDRFAKKRYAETVLSHYKDLSKYLFLRRDERDYTAEIYKWIIENRSQ